MHEPAPHPHACLDDAAFARAGDDEHAQHELCRLCAGCAVCEARLLEWERERTLERSLREAIARSGSKKERLAGARSDELLRSVASATSPSACEETAPRVPGYRVLRELHRGGQGVVYAAVQETTNRPAAIKVLLSGTLASLRERYRFEREIEIIASLRSPHIVAVYGAVTTEDGRLGCAMDLIEGRTLDVWGDQQHAALSPHAARRAMLSLFAKVCRAVQHAHARGVIHRDLKPGNILVDANDEPRVLDFGLARAGDLEAGPLRSLTMPGELLGTPQYAAPEQLELDPREIDGRCDVYALGLLLHRLVCGGLPYTVEGSPRTIIETICRAPLPRPRAIAHASGLPTPDKDLETILIHSLAKDRERRYQTALELAQDVDSLLRGEAIAARRESTLYVVGKWMGRHKAATALSATAGLALLGAIVGGTVLSARAVDARAREHLERTLRLEQATRAEAVSTVIAEILPPPGQSPDAPPARWLEDNLLDLREALDAGWLADRPDLAAQVQSVLSEIYALRGTRSGWYGEAAARTATTLLREAYDDDDPRVLRMREAEAAALIARRRTDEGVALAGVLVQAWRRHGPQWATHEQRARTLRALGLLQRGDPAGAHEEALEATNVRDTSGVPLTATIDAGRAWHTLAQASAHLGKHDEALNAAWSGLRIRMTLRRDTDDEVIQSIEQLAALHGASVAPNQPPLSSQQLGALASALRAAESERDLSGLVEHGEDLIVLKRWLFAEHDDEVAESLALVGNACRREHRWLLAAQWTQRAAEAARASHPAPSITVMNLYSAAAEGYRMVLDPQREFTLSSLAVAEARGLSESTLEPLFRGAVLRDCGSAAARAGHHEQARALLEEALEIFERSTGPTSHVVANGHARMADAALLAGDGTRAQTHALRAEALAHDAPSMPLDQRVSLVGTLALVHAANGEMHKAEAAAREQLRLVAGTEAGTIFVSLQWMPWARSIFAWTLACTLPPGAERDEQARIAREQWTEGTRQLRTLHGVDPHAPPPWEQYPFAALRWNDAARAE